MGIYQYFMTRMCNPESWKKRATVKPQLDKGWSPRRKLTTRDIFHKIFCLKQNIFYTLLVFTIL